MISWEQEWATSETDLRHMFTLNTQPTWAKFARHITQARHFYCQESQQTNCFWTTTLSGIDQRPPVRLDAYWEQKANQQNVLVQYNIQYIYVSKQLTTFSLLGKQSY